MSKKRIYQFEISDKQGYLRKIYNVMFNGKKCTGFTYGYHQEPDLLTSKEALMVLEYLEKDAYLQGGFSDYHIHIIRDNKMVSKETLLWELI